MTRGGISFMKKLLAASLSLAIILATAPSILAFSDVGGSKAEVNIANLQERGVITGINSSSFQPNAQLTYAQAVTMFDKAFNLSLDTIKFVKMPEVSDHYSNMSNDAWYADAFIDSYYNGIVFDQDLNPNDSITREQFAHFLMQQIDRHGNYPLINLYVVINDQNDIDEQYSHDIQKLIILKFADLSEDANFNPKEPITRGEAAMWLDKGLEFVDRTFGNEENQEAGTGAQAENLKVNVESAGDDVNKVSISADVPHPGYSIKVNRIEFVDEIAYIDVKLVDPDPDRMYPQVITNVTVSTYIDKQYTVKLLSDN